VSYAGKKLFPFALREQDWPRHVCISGMSGSGKTTLAFQIIGNFIEKDKPFLVFDWKKSFRPLTLADNDIRLFTVGNDAVSNLFKININKPPKGVSPKEWINVVCDLLTESFFVSFGVHKVLLETLDDAFKEWGIYDGSENYPTWNHIKWRLEERASSSKGREATWIESALRIASVLTFGDFGKTVNYKGEKGFSIEDMLDKKIIFELNTLSNIEKKFFCEFILTYIFKLRKAGDGCASEAGKFSHAIVVDEAHNIFLKDKTHFVQESVTDMIYREMREYGTSLICLDQHVSKLSDSVKGNSACHIAFQQQLPQDIFEISNLMQLADKKEMFSQLEVGSAIVKLAERFTSPFLIEVPFVDLRKQDVSDNDIAVKMRCLVEGKDVDEKKDDFSKAVKGEVELDREVEEVEVVEKVSGVVGFNEVQNYLMKVVEEKLGAGMSLAEVEKELVRAAKVGKNYRISDVLKVVNYIFDKQFKGSLELGSGEVVETAGVVVEADGLSEGQGKFVRFLKDNPKHVLSTVELYKEVGLSPRKGNVVKNELMGKGLIKIHEQKNNRGWKKVIRLS